MRKRGDCAILARDAGPPCDAVRYGVHRASRAVSTPRAGESAHAVAGAALRITRVPGTARPIVRCLATGTRPNWLDADRGKDRVTSSYVLTRDESVL